MRKLDEIEKKSIFEVPEGYFDKLPGMIQSRIEATKPQPVCVPYYRLALRYALPVAAVVFAVLVIFRNGDDLSASPEELLSSVSTEELAIYLTESGVSTEMLLEEVDFDEADLLELSPGSMLLPDDLGDENLDDLLEEFDTEYY
ncbi:MAG: hypothetical protein AB7K37_15780 [Cyclobacteriaceae bacterium]